MVFRILKDSLFPLGEIAYSVFIYSLLLLEALASKIKAFAGA
jgi:hypothetical protein